MRVLRLVTPGATTDREKLFLDRYGRLYDQALALTRNREQAEDLVQDAFVQFVLARTPLDEIRNVDAYLCSTIHHLHVSQVRRAVRASESPLDVVDYDSADLAFRGTDAARRLQIGEELRAICRYACARRLSSKAGTVLLLRFFHGYYIREIAEILKTSAGNVDALVHEARREARSATDTAASGRTVPSARRPLAPGSSAPDTRRQWLDELRAEIFVLAHETCFAARWFADTYSRRAEPLSCAEAAELVTCPHCLDAANRLLGLPLLAERYPTDMLGPDHRSGPDGHSGTGAPGSGQAARMRRAVTDVYEHRPRQLSVAVNGFVVASQTIGSAHSEQTVSVTTGDPIGFVEVFSEQQVRLLFLDVQPPPDGSIEHRAAVELSDGRSVRLELDFSHTWPTLNVAYSDPCLETAGSTVVRTCSEAARTASNVGREQQETRFALTEGHPRADRKGGTSWFHAWWPRLVPATAVILVLAAIGSYLFLRAPTLSAAELLNRAVAAEQSAARATAAVEHRVLQMEERRAEDGAVLGRARVEVWRQADGAVARRVFDDRTGALRALELKNPTGVESTVYRPGAPPEAPAPATALQMVETGEVWRVEVSPATFTQMVASLADARVEETDSTYVVRYEPRAPRSVIVKAVLTLVKRGLRPIAQVLVVRRPEGLREYRFTERALETVSPGRRENRRVFEPDPEFGQPAAPPAPNRTPGTAALLTPDKVTALQVEAFYLLDRVSATLGEQVSVSGGRAGVRVEAVVDTAARKKEIATALAPLQANPAVRIDVQTVAELASRRRPSPASAVVRGVEAPQGDATTAADVRRYFAEHPHPSWPADAAARNERLDRAVLNFGASALERSRGALQRAWALERLVTTVPPETVKSLDAPTSEKWRSMIRGHAQALLEETSRLRTALAPVFGPGAGGPLPAEPGPPADARISDTVHELLAVATAQDEAIRSAFAVTIGEAKAPLSLSSAAFWDTVTRAEFLAKGLAGVQ